MKAEKIDHSCLVYDKYYSLVNKSVEITLINGEVIKGSICAYQKGKEYSTDPFIVKWHIIDEKDKYNLGIDANEFMKGKLINQKDIVQIIFIKDGTILNFNSSINRQ